MATFEDPEWTEFHVIGGHGGNCFSYPDEERPWACVCADSFWRESGEDVMEVIRNGVQFDSGMVTTTGHTRHFTGMEKVAPTLNERCPADMSGEHLSRLCAGRFQVGDVLRVHYAPETFLRHRRNLEEMSWLK
jgi:hypothetical protein